jgi:alanine-glyoxylate transaminase/serine-glyoxylate transaminase/serine-pyruvate transaminase
VNKLDGIEEVLLMGPGPSSVPPEVYTALSRKTLGHLDPYFIEIMDEIKAYMQTVLRTKNRLTLPLSGTGSAGMEAVFVNLVEPGDRVLILSNGVFGGRMQDVATRLGAHVNALEFEWGTPVLPDLVKAHLEENSYKLVAVVHAETSTGVHNPVPKIGKLVKKAGALFLVDGVTSLGGMDVRVDDWGIDAFYSGSQKCLSCPPGLAPVSFSEEAFKVLSERETKVPNWYLDMNMIANYWGGKKRAYHHTAPINLLYGLYEALHLIVNEGLDPVFARHMKCHEALVAGLEPLGLNMFVKPESRLPMLNAVTIPQGVDDGAVRGTLLSKHKIEIGGGLGPMAGKVWRIGLMGHTARTYNVNRLLKALKETLKI